MSTVMTLGPELAYMGDCVLTIGVFDGVHLGHVNLISHTVRTATLAGVPSVLMTFDRDPDTVVNPGVDIVQLLSLAEKIDRLSLTGIDHIVTLPFDDNMAACSPKNFLDGVVLQTMSPLQIIVGEDFRFGNKATGDIGLLKALAAKSGIDVIGMPLLELDGAPVKSTRIKRLIFAGEVERARGLLGRPHSLSGTVIHGAGRGGRLLSTPTINVSTESGRVLPAAGVYSGRAHLHEGDYPAAIFVGSPPSFSDSTFGVEAHLLGFANDVYGQKVTLMFDTRIRDLEEFAAPETLASAIQGDIDFVRHLAGMES